MLRFILKRLLLVIPLVIGITLVSFFVMQLAPGDYLDALRGQPQIRPETIERLRSEFGLVENPTLWDQVKQYGRWLWNAVRGNFGFSFTYKIETFELIKQRLYYTFILSFWATVFAWVVGIPLGIYVARNRNKFGDRIANFVAFAGISLPGFFIAHDSARTGAGHAWCGRPNAPDARQPARRAERKLRSGGACAWLGRTQSAL
jgi:peptide/nickel transport system permease protein